MIQDILLSLLINAIPLLILVIPYPIIRKKTIGKLYFRILLGICVFYLIYWVLPIIFQVGSTPNELLVSESQEGSVAFGMGYIVAHTFTLITLFFSYPLITLPFIFFVAPFISLLFTWNRLRKEEGTTAEKLELVSYEYKESPFKMIRNGLLRSDWNREKEILKLLVVLLPISLYLLQVILDISGLQSLSLTTGETSLGWFLEILFVYLATLIFSIELLFSSKIAIKGRYFGENVRTQTYKSLYQIGAPISFISIILFVLQYTSSILIIIYFFAYFIMASIIFVLFLDIFEPISILLLIKIINFFKNRKTESKSSEKLDWLYGLLFGAGALIVYLIINLGVIPIIFLSIFGNPESADYQTFESMALFSYENPTLFNSLKYDLLIIFGILASFLLPAIIFVIFFLICMKYIHSISIGLIGFVPWAIILMIIYGSSEEFWLTGQLSFTEVFGSFTFYTVRTAAFNANLFVGEGFSFLGVLAIPYLYSRFIIYFLVWNMIIHYIGKDFKTKNMPIDDKHVKKVFYSEAVYFFKYEDYMEDKINYLITKTIDIPKERLVDEREEIKELLNDLDESKAMKEMIPLEEEEKKRFYFTLKYLFSNKMITIWKPEFSLTFEKVEKQGLYVMYTDGRDVFNYAFTESDSMTDPALISGMFSAITSFISETTQSSQFLKTIDHGDITIMIEYGKHVFSALFIKGSQSSEVRAQLKEFIQRFEEKHSEVLPNWNGALAHFNEDHLMVEEIFIEE